MGGWVFGVFSKSSGRERFPARPGKIRVGSKMLVKGKGLGVHGGVGGGEVTVWVRSVLVIMHGQIVLSLSIKRNLGWEHSLKSPDNKSIA